MYPLRAALGGIDPRGPARVARPLATDRRSTRLADDAAGSAAFFAASALLVSGLRHCHRG